MLPSIFSSISSLESERPLPVELIKLALSKVASNRTFDDILLLKSYLSKTEFIKENFSGRVNPHQINELCRGLFLESHQAGDIIFNQGDHATKLYIILAGSCALKVKYTIRIQADDIEIREKTFATYVSGQHFGESALHSHEKRSGTVVALTNCDIVVLTKGVYQVFMEDLKIGRIASDLKDSRIQLGSKENVLKTLSAIRERRTNHELEASAVYLHRNVPFFLKFTLPQIVELCRVSETTVIQGHNILFRQRQIGQAFYVVLGGEVEVWVDSASTTTRPPPSRSQLAIMASMSKNYLNLVSDLGEKVSTLHVGDVFGERALDPASSNAQRAASIVTCNEFTELLIIHKEDYLSLVYTITNSDSMDRLSLLRRTEMYRAVDVIHLKALARFMEPRKFKIDDVVYSAGDNALEMIIIEIGECRVQLDVMENSDQKLKDRRRNSKSEVKTVNMGRIAPHSVLSAYITLCETAYHDILHTETVLATTIVESYVISKHNFFLHVPKETRQVLKKVVNDFYSLPSYPLWENIPRLRNKEQWAKEKCWEKFRKDLVASEKKDSNILDHYKRLTNINFVSADSDIRAKNLEHTATALAEQSKNAVSSPVKVTMKDWGLRQGRQSSSSSIQDSMVLASQQSVEESGPQYLLDASLQQSMSRKIHSRMKDERQMRGDSSIMSAEVELESPSLELQNMHGLSAFTDDFNRSDASVMKPALEIGKTLVAPTSPPFVLVHIHKESNSNQNVGLENAKHRTITCHLRICCAFNSTVDVKSYSDKYMESIYLTVYSSDYKLENELFLRWKSFKGFQNMVLTANDHFFIYCRGTPIEYASISATKNIFSAPFPAVCKQDQQMFVCAVMNQLKPRIQLDDAASSDGDSDGGDSYGPGSYNRSSPKQLHNKSFTKKKGGEQSSSVHLKVEAKKDPQFLKDVSCMYEVVAVFPSRLQGVQYAVERFGFVGGPFKEIIAANTNRNSAEDLRFLEKPSTSSSTLSRGFPQQSAMSPGRPLTQPPSPLPPSISRHMTSPKSSSVHLPGVSLAQTSVRPSSVSSNEDKIQLKDLSTLRQRDRVLELLHMDNKLCCVLPMYEWIQISQENLQQSNFLRVFEEPDMSLTEILKQSSKRKYSVSATSRPDTTQTDVSNASDDENKLNTKMELVKTFSEAGLLKSSQLGRTNEDYVSRLKVIDLNQQKLVAKEYSQVKKRTPDDEGTADKLYEMVATKSVKNLKVAIESKELSKSLAPIVVNSVENKTEKSKKQSTRKSSSSKPSPVSRTEKRVTKSAIVDSDTDFSIAAEDISLYGDVDAVYRPRKPVPKVDEDVMNSRLQHMNKSAEQRALLLQMHDKLCEVEHMTYSDAKYRSKLSSIPSGASGGGASTILPIKGNQIKIDDPRMGFISETLSIVESLQTMHVNLKHKHVGESTLMPPKNYNNVGNASRLQRGDQIRTFDTKNLTEKLQKLQSTFKQ